MSQTKLPDIVGHVVQLMTDAPIVEPLAEFGGGPIEKRALLGGERDGRDAAELRPVRLAGEELRVPADRARLKRLALGVGDRGHRAFQRVKGRKRDVFALDLGEARGEQQPGDEPAKQRPERELRPMQIAMHEAHLRGQGEDGGGDRPGSEPGAVHGQAEQGGKEDERENELSHGRPLNWSRPPPVPD